MSTADIDDRTATMTAYKELLCRLARRTRDIFNSELIGIYLYGSCAMGCFNPYKSDLDIIVVVDGDVSDERKLRFMENLICFDDVAPAKGIEISVVQRRFCKPFVYPTPYELHYSRIHRSRYLSDPNGYVRLMKGVDKDLAAHITIINNCGIVLYGDKISDVFGAVPTENFIDSVYGDIEHAREDISHKPIYVALNLCRFAAFAEDGVYLSKKTGGEWGLKHLPSEYIDIISEVLQCYSSDKAPNCDRSILIDFADYMKKRINKKIFAVND